MQIDGLVVIFGGVELVTVLGIKSFLASEEEL